MPKNKSETRENSASLRQWLRGIGAISILLGFSTSFTYPPLFVPAMVSLYLGLLIGSADVAFEKLKPTAKVMAAAVLIAIGSLVGKYVVFHPDPIDFSGSVYQPDGKIVLRIFDNSESTDYQDFDITIETDPRTFFDTVQETTGAAGVEIFDNNGEAGSGVITTGQTMERAFEPTTGQPKTYLNFRRVRFQLRKAARVEFKIRPREGEPHVTYVHFYGTYRGKYQIRKVDYRVPLTQSSYGLFDDRQ